MGVVSIKSVTYFRGGEGRDPGHDKKKNYIYGQIKMYYIII